MSDSAKKYLWIVAGLCFLGFLRSILTFDVTRSEASEIAAPTPAPRKKRAPAAIVAHSAQTTEASPAQSPEPRAELSNEDLYCRIWRANVGVPLHGQLKMWQRHAPGGYLVLLQSSECPEGLFSKVRLDERGEVTESLDCRSRSREEILSQSFSQGDLEKRPSVDGKLNFALQGPGAFVIRCGDEIYLTRSGDFRNDEGRVMMGHCFVLGRDGREFSWSGMDLDEQGCDDNGSCLAVVEIDPSAVSYVDASTFHAESDPLRNLSSARVLSHTLENLNDPSRGPTGPNWDYVPDFARPLNCEL